jgi:hypothetical protein
MQQMTQFEASEGSQVHRNHPSSSVVNDVGMRDMHDVTDDWESCWSEHMQYWRQHERVVTGRFIATWLLVKDHVHVCVQQRRVRIHDSMSASEFQQACRQMWQDHLHFSDHNLVFHLVHPKPQGLPSTLAHVIIVQGDHENFNCVLYQGATLPTLRKQRAVLFRDGISVREFFVEAQHPSACQMLRAKCFIQHGMEHMRLLLNENEQMDVPKAALVFGEVRVIEEERDSEGETSDGDVESEITTSIPSGSQSPRNLSDLDEWSQDEEQNAHIWSWERQASGTQHGENDVMNLMSGAPVMMQIGHPDPYPRQVEPQLGQVEPEEDLIDTFFANQHQLQLQEYVDQALEGVETDDTVWQAITCGVGLLDLGRRDFPFNPLRLNELPELVQQAWWDHAQYGRLTIFHVFPQPSELGGIHSIVLLISVASPADAYPDVRNVLITQRGDPDAGIRPVSYGAKVLTDSTAREMLIHLGLHKKCKPFTMRNCEIRLGTETMQEDVRYEFDHGLWCCPAFGRLPEYVSRNMERVEQIEQFYLQVEDFFSLRPEANDIVCHVHGVSPENRPMGYRTLVLNRNELQGNDWIEKMWRLWPFDHPFSPITFCPFAVNAKK